MARRRITTYAMLTAEQRLQLLEEIRARLPPDSPQPEEDASMEEEPVEAEETDFALVGFDMADPIAEFDVAQPEEAEKQYIILDSIQSEDKVEVNRRFLRQRNAEIDEPFADMEFNEEPDVRPAANDHKAGGSGENFINISGEEDE